MLLVIDNYDSFTFNLVQYFGQLGVEQRVFRNNEITPAEALALNPERVLLSPGPCSPREAGVTLGIINAFEKIGQAGSASLAVVAPGIAEALIATAVGLFAAIPATIFYNIFVARLRDLQEAIRLFASELEADVARFGEKIAAPARAVEG